MPLLKAPAQEYPAPQFELVQGTSGWLQSTNRAGLYALPLQKIMKAQATAIKSDGGYIDISEGANSLQAGVEAKAYAHAMDKFTFYGQMGYNHFSYWDIGGPVLLNPSYNPVNFYEYPDNNHGKKTKELYSLEGGFSYKISDRFSLGIGGLFESGNFAKRKDPRNINRWMDFGFSLGLMNRFSDSFALGADFRYERTIESVSSRTYGQTGENYFYFIDYGAYLGKVEVLGSDNYFISASAERPMLNNFLGGALQAEFGDLRQGFSFFNEISYRRRTGSFGDKATSEILFSQHKGNELSYKGLVNIQGSQRHRIKAEVQYKDIVNFMNSFSVLSNPGENLEVEYYGQAQTLEGKSVEASLGYEIYIGGTQFHPLWKAGAQVDYAYQSKRSYYYPYTRFQRSDILSLSLHGARSFIVRNNIFDLGIGASVRKGFGTKAEDKVLVEVSGAAPRSASEYLDADWEYRCSQGAQASLSFKYSRIINSKFSVFVGADEKFGSLLKKPEYLKGGFRNVASISVGCVF